MYARSLTSTSHAGPPSAVNITEKVRSSSTLSLTGQRLSNPDVGALSVT
jgi:hypothetical protein